MTTPPTVPWWFAGVGVWATVGLMALGLLAIIPIVQARRARDIEILMEIGRRWDSPEMAKARAKVDALSHNGELTKTICEHYAQGGADYHELMREPGYLEDLGVIFYSGGIRKKTLMASMGFLVPERWAKWDEALSKLGEVRGRREHFSYFREMADEMARGGSHGEHRRRARCAMERHLGGDPAPLAG